MAPRKSVPDDEIRRLYRLPLEEFTAARNALAKALRKEKKPEAAKEVQALAKPSPSAWAVSLLFEHEPAKMKELVAAGRRARDAQGEAVSGRGAAALKEALKAARGLADELRWEAGRILAERGRPPSRAVVERIAANLQALAFSPNAAEDADRGWLERDLEPPGFEVLAGLPFATAPVVDLAARREARKKEEEAKKAPAPEAPRERPEREPEREKEAKKEEEARRQKEAAEAARRAREEEERRRRIAGAKEKVERAREEADSLRKEAERAETEAADARRRAEAAERAADRAREKAETAARRLEIARAQLREAEER